MPEIVIVDINSQYNLDVDIAPIEIQCVVNKIELDVIVSISEN